MNFRLRAQQPDYHVHPTGQFLVPNSPAPKKRIALPPAAPHPPNVPLKVGGRLLDSVGSYGNIFPVLFKHIPPGRGTDGSIVIHAGACRGGESQILYNTYWREFVAIEPDSRNIQDLRRALHDVEQTHGFRAHVWPFAVSDHNGRVTLHICNNKDGSPWSESNTIKEVLLHHQQSPELDWSSEQEVGCCCLDSLWFNMDEPVVHLLFSDVEGAEKEMITGAQDMLRKTRWFFTEFSHAERYEGALGLEDTFKMLPGKWEPVCWWNHGHFGDALFKNLEV